MAALWFASAQASRSSGCSFPPKKWRRPGSAFSHMIDWQQKKKGFRCTDRKVTFAAWK